MGVLAKNESKNEDMVDILETIQEKYVPFTTVSVQSEAGEVVTSEMIFFGGDQLTEERARNIQKARADGQNQKERLEAVYPKNEDWHAIRNAYMV